MLSSQNVIHTQLPGNFPVGYFDDDNISFIQNKVAELLSYEYAQAIIMDRGDIIRVMQRVLEERRENVAKSNQRVIMYLTDDFRTHQIERDRNFNWLEGYASSQILVDSAGQISRFDKRGIKLNSDIKYDGKSRVGGTVRFYFT
jgi:hypothetical protein